MTCLWSPLFYTVCCKLPASLSIYSWHLSPQHFTQMLSCSRPLWQSEWNAVFFVCGMWAGYNQVDLPHSSTQSRVLRRNWSRCSRCRMWLIFYGIGTVVSLAGAIQHKATFCLRAMVAEKKTFNPKGLQTENPYLAAVGGQVAQLGSVQFISVFCFVWWWWLSPVDNSYLGKLFRETPGILSPTYWKNQSAILRWFIQEKNGDHTARITTHS